MNWILGIMLGMTLAVLFKMTQNLSAAVIVMRQSVEKTQLNARNLFEHSETVKEVATPQEALPAAEGVSTSGFDSGTTWDSGATWIDHILRKELLQVSREEPVLSEKYQTVTVYLAEKPRSETAVRLVSMSLAEKQRLISKTHKPRTSDFGGFRGGKGILPPLTLEKTWSVDESLDQERRNSGNKTVH